MVFLLLAWMILIQFGVIMLLVSIVGGCLISEIATCQAGSAQLPRWGVVKNEGKTLIDRDLCVCENTYLMIEDCYIDDVSFH